MHCSRARFLATRLSIVFLAAAALAGCDDPAGRAAGLDASAAVYQPPASLPEGEELVTPPVNPTYADGRLVFADFDHSQRYIATLANQTPSVLAAKESAYPGFTSLRAYLALDSGTVAAANDGVTRTDFVVSDAFLSILNQDGEVRIGGDVWKVTKTTVFRVAAADAAALPSSLSGSTTTTSSTKTGSYANAGIPMESRPVETTYVETTTTEPGSLEASVSAPGSARLAVSVAPSNPPPSCTRYAANPRYRMEGVVFLSSYWLYAEAGVKTRWQRKESAWFGLGSKWVNTAQPGTLQHTYSGTTYFTDLLGGHSGTVSTGTRTWWTTGGSETYSQIRYRFGASIRIGGTISASHSVSNSTLSASCDTYIHRN